MQQRIALIKKYKALTVLTLLLLSLIFIGFDYMQQRQQIALGAYQPTVASSFGFLAMMLIFAVSMIFSLIEKLLTSVTELSPQDKK